MIPITLLRIRNDLIDQCSGSAAKHSFVVCFGKLVTPVTFEFSKKWSDN